MTRPRVADVMQVSFAAPPRAPPRYRRGMRRLSALLAVAAVLALSACSPPVAGMLALTVRDGHLVLLVQSCDAPIVDIRITSDEAGDGFLADERVLPDPVPDGLSEVDLGDAAEFAARLDPDATYSLRGWAQGSSGRAAGPAIRVDDLAIDDGEVLYPHDGHPLEHATGTVTEFVDAAC